MFLPVFVTVLVVLDPVGNIPVFLAITHDHPERRAVVAFHATAVAAIVVLAFAVFGQEVLGLLHISIPALEVSGGLVLVLVALELLAPTAAEPSAAPANPALVPLGTPLLAGPGAIAVTMVYMRSAHGPGQVLEVVAALVAALVVVFVCLRFAAAVGHFLSRSAIDLLSRVVGLLLGAIAVELVAEGVQQWALHGVH